MESGAQCFAALGVEFDQGFIEATVCGMVRI